MKPTIAIYCYSSIPNASTGTHFTIPQRIEDELTYLCTVAIIICFVDLSIDVCRH